MFIKPQYLNHDDLLNYIAITEEGVRQSGSSKSTNTKKLGGSLGAGPLKADASRAGEVENTVSTEDHDYSRLARLIEAGHANPEDFGWLEALDPDNDFSSVGIGAFIEWERDVYIPEFIKILSNSGDLSSTLNTIQAVASSAEALGLDANEIPKSGEVKAMSTFLNSLDSFKVTPVVVGEDSSTDWKVVGPLDKQWIHQRASLDDRVRTIGKVKKSSRRINGIRSSRSLA